LKKKIRNFVSLCYFPKYSWVTEKNFSPIGSTVWPAIAKIFTNTFIYRYTT